MKITVFVPVKVEPQPDGDALAKAVRSAVTDPLDLSMAEVAVDVVIPGVGATRLVLRPHESRCLLSTLGIDFPGYVSGSRKVMIEAVLRADQTRQANLRWVGQSGIVDVARCWQYVDGGDVLIRTVAGLT